MADVDAADSSVSEVDESGYQLLLPSGNITSDLCIPVLIMILCTLITVLFITRACM